MPWFEKPKILTDIAVGKASPISVTVLLACVYGNKSSTDKAMEYNCPSTDLGHGACLFWASEHLVVARQHRFWATTIQYGMVLS